MIKSYSRQQKVIALSSAEAELYAMVAASAETFAVIACAADLGMSFGGEVYADSSAALGITQRIGIGKVRHLRTQGLWVQETGISGRLAYHTVLGTKDPADVLTKHVPGELLERHLGTLGAEVRGGRSELAPELMSLATSWLQWYRPLEGEEEAQEECAKKVTFAKRVLFRAVEHANKGRSCKDRSVGRINSSWKTTENDKVEKQRWCDMVDTRGEEQEERERAMTSRESSSRWPRACNPTRSTTEDPEGEACTQPRVLEKEDTEEKETSTKGSNKEKKARGEQEGALANSRRLAQTRYQERPPPRGPDIVYGGNHSYGSGSRLTFGSGSDRRKWTSAIKRVVFHVTKRMELVVGAGRAVERNILFQDCYGQGVFTGVGVRPLC